MTLSNLTLTTYSLLSSEQETPTLSRLQATLRKAAASRDLSAFEAEHFTFRQPMATFAFLECNALFQGWTQSSWLTGDAMEKEEEQGIYRTHSDLFHLDSEDFEHDMMENEARGAALAGKMMDAGCNFSQSTSALPMSRMVMGVFRGSIIDILRFTRTVGRRTVTDYHPHTRELAETMMAELLANHRPLVDALVEGEAV